MRVLPESFSRAATVIAPAVLLTLLAYPAHGQAPVLDPARDNDLLYLVQHAPVDAAREPKPGDKDDFNFQLNISGNVVGAGGQPLAGAVVCLLEDSVMRRRSESTLLPDDCPERGLGLNARATTDAQGRFAFTNIKTSAGEKEMTRWYGFVIAAHPSAGIGWASLEGKPDRVRTETNIAVHLKKFADISGIYQTTDGQPIAGAELSLFDIDEGKLGPWIPGFPRPELRLTASALMPIARTNAKGEYKFRNLPTGYAAIVLAPQGKEHGSSLVAIATDPAMKLGSRGQERNPFKPNELLGTNRALVAPAALRIRGTLLDEEGRPVAQATITGPYRTSTRTDAQGKFDLRIQRVETGMKAEIEGAHFPIYPIEILPSNASSLLPRSEYIIVNANNQILVKRDTFADSIDIKLEKGVHVIGKVVDEDGKPLQGVVVEELGQVFPVLAPGQAPPPPPKKRFVQGPRPRTTTGEDGVFELVLTAEPHKLHFSSRAPGLQLPQSVRGHRDTPGIMKLPHIEFNLEDGQPVALTPFRVKRIPAVEVKVLMPDGTPAERAEVVLWEHREEQMFEAFDNPNNFEMSPHVFTDAEGKAALLPIGQPSIRATAKAKLFWNNNALEGEIRLDRGNPAVIHLFPDQPGVLRVP